MRRVLIQEATPGMVLAKPVTNSTGGIIIAAGMVLDDALLGRLEKMGRGAVYIEGTTPAAVGDATPEELERELASRFRRVSPDPVQELIHETIRRHLLSFRHPSDSERPA
jgi:hypothetical protein